MIAYPSSSYSGLELETDDVDFFLFAFFNSSKLFFICFAALFAFFNLFSTSITSASVLIPFLVYFDAFPTKGTIAKAERPAKTAYPVAERYSPFSNFSTVTFESSKKSS